MESSFFRFVTFSAGFVSAVRQLMSLQLVEVMKLVPVQLLSLVVMFLSCKTLLAVTSACSHPRRSSS